MVQWHWLQQAVLPREPDADQFNSLHEKLIARWRALAVTWSADTVVHFTCAADSDEDRGNLEYLRDVATQAGLSTRSVGIDDIGWDGTTALLRRRRRRRDRRAGASSIPGSGSPREAFGPNLLASGLRVIEPRVEDAAVEQGAAADPVGAVSRPPEPAAGVSSSRAGSTATSSRSRCFRARAPTSSLRRGGSTSRRRATTAPRAAIYQALRADPALRRRLRRRSARGSSATSLPASACARTTGPITRNTSRFVPHYFV